MISEATKPLQLVSHAAEFKFESKFEPLQVIWQSLRRLCQKTIEGLEGKINGQTLGAALRLCLRGSKGRAQTHGVSWHFRVGGSRCGPPPARLKKTCYHSCDTDSVQESTSLEQGFNAFNCFVDFGPRRVTFFFHVK